MSVSALNSLAVSHMQHGDYKSATFVLKRALDILKASLLPDGDAPEPQSQRSSLSLLISTVPVALAGKTLGECGTFEVFTRAFDFPQEVATDSNRSQASLCLLYNMGLSYQLCALSTGNSRELRLARELYKMALAVVENCLVQALNDTGLLLQLLAIFHNMASIHESCFEADQTAHCLSALGALLASRSFREAKAGSQGETFLFFEWNKTLSASKPLFAFAPAA